MARKSFKNLDTKKPSQPALTYSAMRTPDQCVSGQSSQ